MLFKKQRNDLFAAIIAAGLQPTDFREINGNEKYNLFAKEGPFALGIEAKSGYFSMGTFPDIEGFDNGGNLYWESCVEYCQSWAEFIKEDNDTPDLWAEAQSNAKLFTLNAAVPNEMFNSAELRQLEGQVRQLISGIIALALPAHAEKTLTDTVKEIPEKATRFTKKELEGWFMGAFISQVTNLALSPEHVTAVAHLIKTTFFGLLGLS
ncbi:MAG: hypothetical protein ACRYFZ_00840 [Janthinobacterium lividum]